MHINCRSLLHKLHDIETLLLQLDIDTLAVTETWLDHLCADTIKIRGHNFSYKCRETDRHDAVGFCETA